MRAASIMTLSLSLCASVPAAAQVPYSAMDCEELWFARNLIYNEAGYCFRTQRAIRQFGTANCRFVNQDDVPLSNVDRQNIRSIQSFEARRGCPR